MIVIILLLFVLVLLTYNYYVKYGRNGRLINNIPGPSGYPIIGNTLILLGSTGKLKFLIHFHYFHFHKLIIII